MARTIQFIMKAFTGIILMLTCSVACRKELPQARNANTALGVNTYAQLFEEFWNVMNSRYQFWDKDTTDWDAMYSRYQPLFAKLDINNEDDQRKSVHYFTAMLSGTLDAHFILTFYPPAIADSLVWPRLTQNALTVEHIQNINPILLPGEAERTPDWYFFNYYDLDAANYLDGGSIRGTYFSQDIGVDVNVLEGTIHNNILYFGYDTEALTEALNDGTNNILKSAYSIFTDALQNNTNVKVAFVDMRGGGTGGYGQDAITMASDMIDKRIMMGITRYKNGTGRLDYTPWEPTYIDPASGAKAIKVPLIILTDVLTFSAAEHVTAALHAVPGAITVGTATRGGNIGVMDDNMQGSRGPDLKQLNIGNFLNLNISAGVFRNPDGSDTYWGIKPDIEVPFDTTAILAGRDTQLEKALSLIH